jgi:hypothetical protein
MTGLQLFDDAGAEDRRPLGRLTPLHLPRVELDTVNYLAGLEVDGERNIGFAPGLVAQVSLPYRNPGDIPRWERTNGLINLTMSPGTFTEQGRNGGTKVTKYAYGMTPRHAFVWLATEAIRTNSPHIELGRNLGDFLKKIGKDDSGKSYRDTSTQLLALFTATMSVEAVHSSADTFAVSGANFVVAKSHRLYWSKNETLGRDGLFNSEVTLSADFFQSIMDSPVPIDLDAVKALGRSPMRVDMYVWLTWRMSTLSRVTKIRWTDLAMQFGAQYGRTRGFREKFRDEIVHVQRIYPDLRVDCDHREYVTLYPSRTHVPRTPPRRQLRGGSV